MSLYDFDRFCGKLSIAECLFLNLSYQQGVFSMTELPRNDSCAVGTAIGTPLIDNKRTKVTEWSFSAKGDNTGWHKHDNDYVVIPLFTGDLCIFDGDKKSISSLSQGVPYFRERGVAHDVINANDFPCKFIEVEFL